MPVHMHSTHSACLSLFLVVGLELAAYVHTRQALSCSPHSTGFCFFTRLMLLFSFRTTNAFRDVYTNDLSLRPL